MHQGGSGETPFGQFQFEFLAEVAGPEDAAVIGREREEMALLAEGIHATVPHGGCRAGTTFVVAGFQRAGIRMGPDQAAGFGVEAGDHIKVILVAHGEDAPLHDRDARETDADPGRPCRLRIGWPTVEPVGVPRDAIQVGAAPLRPVEGMQRGETCCQKQEQPGTTRAVHGGNHRSRALGAQPMFNCTTANLCATSRGCRSRRRVWN
jgi:hypothetical protein